MNNAFYGCTALETINGEIDLSKSTTARATFYECRKLKHSPIINYGDQLTDVSSLYQNCVELEELDLTTLNYQNLQSYDNFLLGVNPNCAIKVKDADMASWITENWADLTNITYDEV